MRAWVRCPGLCMQHVAYKRTRLFRGRLPLVQAAKGRRMRRHSGPG